MLNILNMIVLINNKVTGHVQELNIKCTTGNLIILAEVVIYNPQTKENVTGFYAIESIYHNCLKCLVIPVEPVKVDQTV